MCSRNSLKNDEADIFKCVYICFIVSITVWKIDGFLSEPGGLSRWQLFPVTALCVATSSSSNSFCECGLLLFGFFFGFVGFFFWFCFVWMFAVDSFSRGFVVKNVSTLMGKVITWSGSSFQYIRALVYFLHTHLFGLPQSWAHVVSTSLLGQRGCCWSSCQVELCHCFAFADVGHHCPEFLGITCHLSPHCWPVNLSVDQAQHRRKCYEAASGEVQSGHEERALHWEDGQWSDHSTKPVRVRAEPGCCS